MAHRREQERLAKRMRRQLHNSTDGKCGICNQVVKFSRMTIDHVIPMSRGGSTTDLSNLQPAHAWCNHVKGNLLPEEMGPIQRARIASGRKQRYHNKTARIAIA